MIQEQYTKSVVFLYVSNEQSKNTIKKKLLKIKNIKPLKNKFNKRKTDLPEFKYGSS